MEVRGGRRVANAGLHFAAFLALLAFDTALGACSCLPPPSPILPIPTARQLEWQERELLMFHHFGMNTFTNQEWGSGQEDPSLFNPTDVKPEQWVAAAKAGGFKASILTTKHHDGFCLWPSAYSNHSVKSSPWLAGKGDVVGLLSKAAKEGGIGFGVYLSPWDRHDSSYADTDAYNEHYMGQLRELLTSYGAVTEVWMDGAKGDDRPMVYHINAWFATVQQLQPPAVIFSSKGPDVRWVGNEKDYGAPSTNWAPFNLSASKFDGTLMPALKEGTPDGPDWAPAECDVSIRPGWFWHAVEHPKPLKALLDIYMKTVGRNCVLLLNVPPNQNGVIEDEDVQRLIEFRAALQEIFSADLARLAVVRASSTRGRLSARAASNSRKILQTKGGQQKDPVKASSVECKRGTATLKCPDFQGSQVQEPGIRTFWAPSEDDPFPGIELDFGEEVSFNLLLLQEPIGFGQRVAAFEVHLYKGVEWSLLFSATTIGYKRLESFSLVSASKLRLVVTQARGLPLIARLGVYHSAVLLSPTVQDGVVVERK